MTQHFKKICSECGVTISQCKCPSVDKEITTGICEMCSPKPDKKQRDCLEPKPYEDKVIEDYNRRIDENNYDNDGGGIKSGTDTLLDEDQYPESRYEIDAYKLEDFIRTALQQQRSEIEKCLPENIFDEDKEMVSWLIFDALRQKFINNLKNKGLIK